MPDAVGLTIIKRFTYRGDATEEYANNYWLTGSVPADAAAWRALFNALVLQEKTVYDSSVVVVRGYGYDDWTGHESGSDDPPAPAVWSVDLTISPETPVAGTFAVGTSGRAPGDAAVWCRWKTSRLNSKGKAIWLRKYFHPAFYQPGATSDAIYAAQGTALNAFALKLRDGTFLDARTLTAAGRSDVLVSSGSSPYVTTRTLKRRGKRPGS